MAKTIKMDNKEKFDKLPKTSTQVEDVPESSLTNKVTTKKPTFAYNYYKTLQDSVALWNKECARQKIENVYELTLTAGTAPLKTNKGVIKDYQQLKLMLYTSKGKYQLYISYYPISTIQAQRSDHWKLDLFRDMMHQMLTNYTLMAHASILQKEDKLRNTKEQIGSLVDSTGQPIMKETIK